MPKTVVDIKYVGTAGHKLFRSEDINRQPGSYLPASDPSRTTLPPSSITSGGLCTASVDG